MTNEELEDIKEDFRADHNYSIAALLPYQVRWLRDYSRYKAWEKSRRIGATYAQALEDVLYAARSPSHKNLLYRGSDVFYTAVDEEGAKGYIAYCAIWCEELSFIPAFSIEKGAMQTLKLTFPSGNSIYAMPSNPKAFRGRGGKVVIDEIAFHKDPEEMFKAAGPCITWGFPMRVFSSVSKSKFDFFSMWMEEQRTKGEWSIHSTSLRKAISEGFTSKVLGKTSPATQEEVDAFVKSCRIAAVTEEAFLQEYMLIQPDNFNSWLSGERVQTAMSRELPEIEAYYGHTAEQTPLQEFVSPVKINPQGTYWVGVDVGREHDLTVITLIEGDLLDIKVVQIVELHQMQYDYQEKIISGLCRSARFIVLDATGNGSHLAENILRRRGDRRVEALKFTVKTKSEMANAMRNAFDGGNIQIPYSGELGRDLMKVKRIFTNGAGTQEKFVSISDNEGHADRFWSLAMAIRAMMKKPFLGEFGIETSGARTPLVPKVTDPGRRL